MSKKNDMVVEESNKIANYLKKHLDRSIIILGPSSANVPKINDIYYYQIILKYKDTNQIKPALLFIIQSYQQKRHVDIDVDFCPYKI